MKVLLVLAALVAFAAADCTKMQRLKVKEQWHEIYGTGNRRIGAGKVLWRAVFLHAPESRELFKGVGGDDINSADFAAHSIRVLGALEMAIDLLDHPDELHHALAHLHEQHIARHVGDANVIAFKEALLHIVPAGLGRCYDSEAWTTCLDVITKAIFGV